MKRYDCHIGEYFERPEGEFVRFEDAERLRDMLFRHACHCGRQGEDPALHSPWCAYRAGCLGEPQTARIDTVSGNDYSTVHGKDESGTAPGAAREAREDGPEAV